MSKLLKQPVKLALVQLATGANKAANLASARAKVLEAAQKHGARIVVLPECFNSPYGTKHFPGYAEPLRPVPPPQDVAPSWHALSAIAKEANVYLIGGSIPERDTTDPSSGKPRLYNTSLVFSPTGEQLAAHRKVHLFDIDIPGGITFRESDALSPGNKITLVDLADYGTVAVAICYDVRFPELAAIAARRGAFLLVYPGAFNTTTGPLHWELLGRARAVDNQVYVALCSPARDDDAEYRAWGHSMVLDPQAVVLAQAGVGEETVVVELRPERIEEVRSGIPVGQQRRFDVYPDVAAGGRFEEDD